MHRHPVCGHQCLQALRPAVGVILHCSAKHLEERAIQALYLAVTLRMEGRSVGLLNAGEIAQLLKQFAFEILSPVAVNLPRKTEQSEEPIIDVGPRQSEVGEQRD